MHSHTHVARASSSALLAAQSRKSEPAKPSDKTMTDLWFRMTAMYGHRWSTTFGETFGDSGPTGAMWQTALTGVTNAMIAKALHSCITRDDGAWPPSLPEFRALCWSSGKPQPAAGPTDEWKSARADPAKIPSAERVAWHKANIAWVEKGGELPRPGSVEPPAPAGCTSFWSIYKGPDMRSSAEKAMSRDQLSEDWL